MGKVHKRTMTLAELTPGEKDEILSQCRGVINHAADVWEHIKPLYEGRDIDSKKVDAMCLAILKLAEMHPDFDRWTRSRS